MTALKTFWVDIENAPHVLVMRPLIEWLTEAGYGVEVTARDYGQTVALLELFGIRYTLVGRHAGKRLYRKLLSFVGRSMRLLAFARKRRFVAAICHGARGTYLPAKLLGIPLVVMGDYEHGALPRFMWSWRRLLLVPEVMPDEVCGIDGRSRCELRKFPGLKEELYVYDCEPDAGELAREGIDLHRPLVLVRPPASMAHYHVAEGDRVFWDVLRSLQSRPDVQVLLLPRTDEQAAEIRSYLNGSPSSNVRIPQKVGYGPNLIYHSDLVISGGGTMNREAACMGIPVFSIFRGPLGAVDRHLIREGKLKMLESARDLDSLDFAKGSKPDLEEKRAIRRKLIEFIGQSILAVVREGVDSSPGSTAGGSRLA